MAMMAAIPLDWRRKEKNKMVSKANGQVLGRKGAHTKSRGACMVNLANSETESNHRGWSEHKNPK